MKLRLTELFLCALLVFTLISGTAAQALEGNGEGDVVNPQAATESSKYADGVPGLENEPRTGAGTLRIALNFDPADLAVRSIDGVAVVTLRSCQLSREVGKPALPSTTISVPLPPGARVVGIAVLAAEKQALTGTFAIAAARPPVPISDLNETNETASSAVPGVAAVYQSPDPYPGVLFKYRGGGQLRGQNLASIELFPLQYYPRDQSLVLFTDMTLSITYQHSLLTEARPPRTKRFDALRERAISNPAIIASSGMQAPLAGADTSLALDDAAYLIITSDALKDAFQPLAAWKTQKGIPARIVTVSSITANYPGIDTQEKIRNCIREASTTWGTEWVLLGGDTDVVPHRGAYGYVEGSAASSTGGWADYTIPADRYYSDLDGSWNADGDAIYGEVTDNVDLYPDVFVGRAPVNTVAEAETFVAKTLQYEKSPPVAYERDLLFLAEKLYDSPATWGGDVKDVIDLAVIPPVYDPITKLYERDGTISKASAIAAMNAGPHLVNHVGHGNTGCFCVGSGCIYRSDAAGLHNAPANFILYTISCYSNAIDADALSEHFMNNPAGGTVAYIGNTRYGFFIPGYPGDGPSDLYDLEFYRSLYADELVNLGAALADSKLAYIGWSQEDGNGMRWLQYALTLLGDPELSVWTDLPRHFTINYPPALAADRLQELRIQVLEGSEPVEGASVCVLKGDDGLYNLSTTDTSGNVSFWVVPGEGAVTITVTKHNYIPTEVAIPVIAGTGGPNVVIQVSNLSFGRMLPGRSSEIHVSITINNTGDVPAEIQAVFKTNLSGVYGLNGTAGQIIPGQYFKLGPQGNETALSSTSEPIIISTVYAAQEVSYDAILVLPPGQEADDYAGTVELSWGALD